MNNKHAIVVTSIDGLNTLQCGIGSMVNWFFEGFNEIKLKSNKLNTTDFDLFAVAPEIDKQSTDFSKTVYYIVSNTCHSFGGELLEFPVLDPSNLSTVWSLADEKTWHTMAIGG